MGIRGTRFLEAMRRVVGLRTHEEERVEEALDESFPASDPPAHHGADNPPSNRAAQWAARNAKDGSRH